MNKNNFKRLGFYSAMVSTLTISLGFATITPKSIIPVHAQAQVTEESTSTRKEETTPENNKEPEVITPSDSIIVPPIVKEENPEEDTLKVDIEVPEEPVEAKVISKFDTPPTEAKIEETPEEIQGDSLPFYQVNTAYLNVRQQPNADSKIVDTLVQGWIVEIDKQESNGWYSLKGGGYINGKYVTFLDPMKAAELWQAQQSKPKPQPVFEQPKPVVPVSNVNSRNNINTNKNETQPSSSGYSASDLDLLARLVNAEAKGEPFQGKVAVAIVVLNRVDSGKFPNSIRGVIYQRGQFSPVNNGAINRPADEESKRAVQEAIHSSNRLNGSLYFYNPRTATSRWLDGLETSAVIGAHVFKK